MFILEAKLCGDKLIFHHEMFFIIFPIVFLPNEIRSYFPPHYVCGEVGPGLISQQLLQILHPVGKQGLSFLSYVTDSLTYVS